MKNVRIVAIESDFGAGVKGAKLGPGALLKALPKSLTEQIPLKVTSDTDLNEDEETPFALHASSILEMQRRAMEDIREVIEAGATPWILSGDHSNGLAAISAYKEQFPKNKLGVIWIDAHADLHTPFSTHSGNMHGMPLAAALGIAEDKNARNQPDRLTLSYWKDLTRLGEKRLHPKINPSDLVFIDVRDLEEEEINLLNQQGIKYYTPADRKEKGLNSIIEEVRNHLSHCQHILVSFDVDSLDPSISYGTGTPVPDGLQKDEAVELLSAFLSDPKLFAFEITEINPLLDRHNPMEQVAAEILEKSFQRSGFLG